MTQFQGSARDPGADVARRLLRRLENGVQQAIFKIQEAWTARDQSMAMDYMSELRYSTSCRPIIAANAWLAHLKTSGTFLDNLSNSGSAVRHSEKVY